MGFFDFLRLPETALITDPDSASTAVIHRQIIVSKPFLKRLYVDFYADLNRRIPETGSARKVVEIGSGPGFIKEAIPDVITSDVISEGGVDQVFSAESIPFPDATIDAFLMLNVFHHLPNVEQCLKEMERCLRPGGKIILIEPSNTPWNNFISKNFHHEPFDEKAGWKIEGQGRLSAGNGALPWIVFVRDRKTFAHVFPNLTVNQIDLHTPFRYLLSGGLSFRALMPNWMYRPIKFLEFILSPLNCLLASFQTIEIVKKVPATKV